MPEPKRSTITLQGKECALFTWEQGGAKKGVVAIYHGFLAHSRYATVRYAAELLSQRGYCVVAADLPGHGDSPGERGYLSGVDDLMESGLAVAVHASNQHCSAKDDGQPLPLFLLGSSMGGAIALAVAHRLSSGHGSGASSDDRTAAANALKGVMLLAPMLALNVSTPLRHVLYAISCLPLVSTYHLIPSSSTSAEKQYRDADKRKECEDDPLCVNAGGKIMPISAWTCVELANVTIGEHLGEINVPFLCMVAKEDVVVKNEGSHRLMKEAASTDKELKEYDALHGLLCEPKPLLDAIHGDLLAWIDKRST